MEYTIIAGVNGAGKSTLYHSGTLEPLQMSIRINVDELIQKEYDNQWQDEKIQFQAGKRTVNRIKNCIINKESFNQETTLAGSTIIRTIKETKERGFKISLHYIGLSSVDLSIERVKARAEKGGHSVDEETIKNRYTKSLENLSKVLPVCDRVYIYDNSVYLEDILKVEDKKIVFINKNIPSYLKNILCPYIDTILVSKEISTRQSSKSIQEIMDGAKQKAAKQLNFRDRNEIKSDVHIE